jgi:hypothetical protein
MRFKTEEGTTNVSNGEPVEAYISNTLNKRLRFRFKLVNAREYGPNVDCYTTLQEGVSLIDGDHPNNPLFDKEGNFLSGRSDQFYRKIFNRGSKSQPVTWCRTGFPWDTELHLYKADSEVIKEATNLITELNKLNEQDSGLRFCVLTHF